MQAPEVHVIVTYFLYVISLNNFKHWLSMDINSNNVTWAWAIVIIFPRVTVQRNYQHTKLLACFRRVYIFALDLHFNYLDYIEVTYKFLIYNSRYAAFRSISW